ncbi:hypothetical protein [Lyngbya aestuarii]|uniref:hypothetical protein n=1 Tax=Lyngbya aestuarii TaxID=118322 RepID=UPI00403D9EC6
MKKHYILTLNPTAKHQWDRCILRDPITAEHPNLESLITQVVGEDTGSYLIALNIEIQVLEKAVHPQPQKVPVETPAVIVNQQRSELVA